LNFADWQPLSSATSLLLSPFSLPWSQSIHLTWSISTQHNSHYTLCNICTQIKSRKVIVKVRLLSPSMWLSASAIIHRHRINRCPSPVKVIFMLSYHFLAISHLQQANHSKTIWTNHTRVQQKMETYYQSRCSTRSGQLIGVSRIAAFVVFYKGFNVTHVHTGGACKMELVL
jgi:hypothetical protein